MQIIHKSVLLPTQTDTSISADSEVLPNDVTKVFRKQMNEHADKKRPRTYSTYQNHFLKYCENEKISEAVTPKKVLNFLTFLKTRGKVKVNKTGKGSGSKEFSIGTIESAISALIDLWKYQADQEFLMDGILYRRSADSPRSDDVIQFKKMYTEDYFDRMTRNRTDPTANTCFEGSSLSSEVLIDMSRQFYANGSQVCMRTCTHVMFGMKAINRCVELRTLKLSNFLFYRIDEIGPSECISLLGILRSYTRKDNKAAPFIMPAIFAKDYRTCACVAWAWYQFVRFEIDGELLPDIKSGRDDLFDRCAFASSVGNRDKTKPISHQAMANQMKSLLQLFGIKSEHVTHLMRHFSSEQMEVKADGHFDADQHVRIGGWNRDARTAFYCGDIPMSGCMQQAGHPSKEFTKKFHLPHFATTEDLPDKTILAQVGLYNHAEDFYDFIGDDHKKILEDGKEVSNAALYYAYSLQVITKLVLLTAPLIQRDAPNSRLFNHPLFRTTEYADFACTARRRYDERMSNSSVLSTASAPTQNSGCNGNCAQLERQIASMQKTLDKVDRQLATVCERNYISSDGPVPKRGKGGIANEGIEGTSNRKVNLTDGFFVEVGNELHNPATDAETPAIDEPPLPTKSTHDVVSASNNNLYANMVPHYVPTTPVVANTLASNNINRMNNHIVFEFNRNVSSITEIWEEKTNGLLHNGIRMDSFDSVLKEYGDTWMKHGRDGQGKKKEKSMKSLRKIVWDTIEHLAIQSFSGNTEQATMKLQVRFVEAKTTLSNFTKILRKERQERQK